MIEVPDRQQSSDAVIVCSRYGFIEGCQIIDMMESKRIQLSFRGVQQWMCEAPVGITTYVDKERLHAPDETCRLIEVTCSTNGKLEKRLLNGKIYPVRCEGLDAVKSV